MIYAFQLFTSDFAASNFSASFEKFLARDPAGKIFGFCTQNPTVARTDSPFRTVTTLLAAAAVPKTRGMWIGVRSFDEACN